MSHQSLAFHTQINCSNSKCTNWSFDCCCHPSDWMMTTGCFTWRLHHFSCLSCGGGVPSGWLRSCDFFFFKESFQWSWQCLVLTDGNVLVEPWVCGLGGGLYPADYRPLWVSAGVRVLRMEQFLPECVTGLEVDLLKILLRFPQTGDIPFSAFFCLMSGLIFFSPLYEHLWDWLSQVPDSWATCSPHLSVVVVLQRKPCTSLLLLRIWQQHCDYFKISNN